MKEVRNWKPIDSFQVYFYVLFVVVGPKYWKLIANIKHLRNFSWPYGFPVSHGGKKNQNIQQHLAHISAMRLLQMGPAILPITVVPTAPYRPMFYVTCLSSTVVWFYNHNCQAFICSVTSACNNTSLDSHLIILLYFHLRSFQYPELYFCVSYFWCLSSY